MAERKLLVNLDAMIKRADFAQTSDSQITFDKIPTISIRDSYLSLRLFFNFITN